MIKPRTFKKTHRFLISVSRITADGAPFAEDSGKLNIVLESTSPDALFNPTAIRKELHRGLAKVLQQKADNETAMIHKLSEFEQRYGYCLGCNIRELQDKVMAGLEGSEENLESMLKTLMSLSGEAKAIEKIAVQVKEFFGAKCDVKGIMSFAAWVCDDN